MIRTIPLPRAQQPVPRTIPLLLVQQPELEHQTILQLRELERVLQINLPWQVLPVPQRLERQPASVLRIQTHQLQEQVPEHQIILL